MDKRPVYPGAIPLDLDTLTPQRNVEIALGFLMRMALGTTSMIDGLTVTQTASPSMAVLVGPGSVTSATTVDTLGTGFGSLPVDNANPLIKMGINLQPTTMGVLTPPATPGNSVNVLVEAQFIEADGSAVVLPFYNASNPSIPYTGPGNAGTASNTARTQTVQLQYKYGTAAATGQQNTPTPDAGWVAVAVVTLTNGQSSVVNANISAAPSAPYVPTKLSSQRVRLSAPLTLYCSTFGSDTANSGLSAASPFLTVQKAWSTVVNNYDLNGFVITIQLANGTYTAPLVAQGVVTGGIGAYSVVIQGNMGSPASVIWSTGNATCCIAQNGGALTVQGVTLQNSGVSGQVNCLAVNVGGIINFGTVIFGACLSAHIVTGNGGTIIATSSYTISNTAPAHWFSANAGMIYTAGITITLNGTAFAGTFALAQGGAISAGAVTFVQTVTATGVKYSALLGGSISTGTGNVNYFPGTGAGSSPSGYYS